MNTSACEVIVVAIIVVVPVGAIEVMSVSSTEDGIRVVIRDVWATSHAVLVPLRKVVLILHSSPRAIFWG